ncbi:hypothetical protein NLI96_g1993 [Meripilus lineatus]|uniref:C3H1-type domain-containing protein n=1 Tax=Meripilus lineatus TaxID=2056292 RepID=A0AAD5YMC5_9APHY|nr:hypothetical protein NLI96_g1993 [Physisporinus lineatus]
MDPSSSAAALKLEIARLTGAIQRRKTEDARVRPYPQPSARPRSNVYVNPNYKPPSKQAPPPAATFNQRLSGPLSSTTHDVVIGGVAFESSGRSLVRKDLPKPATTTVQPSRPPRSYTRPPVSRGYIPKPIRGRATNRNMTLTNSRRPYQSVFTHAYQEPSAILTGRFRSRRVSKKTKVDKPCPRFTTTGASPNTMLNHEIGLLKRLLGHRLSLTITPFSLSPLGACNRGLTCMYQHDPAKIAICWNFLQGNCPNTAETCNLSHDPTPERTPLCVHFANNHGRCTRPNCLFPHVRVGQRQGVCRDFAVLGYCEKGLDCEQSHVRECPDFAEKGVCNTKGCKLPHVIRANRNRKATTTNASSNPSAVSSTSSTGSSRELGGVSEPSTGLSDVVSGDLTRPQMTVDDAQMGDEFISLMFHESESEEAEDDEDDEEENEGDEDEDEEADTDMQGD